MERVYNFLRDHLGLELAWFFGIFLFSFLRARNSEVTTKENGMVVKVDVVMQVPKEGKEVIDALASILKDVKAGKPIAEIAGGNLQKLIMAVDGFEKLGEEVKSDGKDELAGYMVQQNMEALGI